MITNLISQAGTMETSGTPNDLLMALGPIAVILQGPLCEFIIYPILHRMGIPLHPITGITCGFILVGIAMAYAAAATCHLCVPAKLQLPTQQELHGRQSANSDTCPYPGTSVYHCGPCRDLGDRNGLRVYI